MSDQISSATPGPRRLGRLAARVLWYGLPALAAAAVCAYIAGAVLWHANPPIVPVAGVSMRPTIQPGDLVFLKGVDPTGLRKGDVIAVRVPADDRSKYGLPAEIVHRIVRVTNGTAGLMFVTKGDANAGNDVFTTPPGDVIGREVGVAPGLGYPFLFFRSTQGKIFVGAAIAVALLYFLLGVFEERRAFTEGTAVAFHAILAETNALKETLGGRAAPASEPTDRIEATMHELVAAVGEYGTHLRSHTEVMQNLAATTGELQQATAALRETVAGAPPEQQTPAAAAPPEPLPPVLLKRSLRGVSRESVDALLESMTRRFADASLRLAELERQRTLLEAERNELQSELADYRRLELETRATLALAQQTVTQLTERIVALEQAPREPTGDTRAQLGAQVTHDERGPGLGEGAYLPE